MENTRTIILDFSRFRSRAAVHETLRAALQSEDYIGNNLDALHDALTSLRRDALLQLRRVESGRKKLGPYCDTLLACLADAAEENPHLKLALLPEEEAPSVPE